MDKIRLLPNKYEKPVSKVPTFCGSSFLLGNRQKSDRKPATPPVIVSMEGRKLP